MPSVRRLRTARAPRAVVPAVLVTVTVTALLTSSCSGGDDSSGTPPPRPTASAVDKTLTVEDLDTTALVVHRTPFCEQVDPAAVTRALGARAAKAKEYRSGERTRVSAHVDDVVHEFGCSWSAAGSTARAWVFVPPVTRQRAGALVHQATAAPHCATNASGAAYGRPSVSLRCQAKGGLEVSFRGLFGDAWLTCTLTSRTGTGDETASRATRWCAAVAAAASS